MFLINATDYAPVTPLVAPCEITPIFIGYKGENLARCLTVDMTDCAEQFGAGSVQISFLRPGEQSPYIVLHKDMLDGVAIWQIDSTDTAAEGYGMVQFQYITSGGVVAKSALYRTVTFGSSETPGDVPDPYEGLLDQIAAFAASAEDSAAAAAASAAQAGSAAAAAVAPLQAQLDEAIAGVTVDSEVINARVGYDGSEYATAGAAIRGQVSDLHNALPVYTVSGHKLTIH